MARKLTDGAVAHLRELWREGVSAGDLSAMFGVSRQHVSRLVREEQRPVIAGLDADRLRSNVSEAVDAFLADAELGPDDAAMAAVARTLAAKIDALATAETVAAAQAVPRLSAELAVVLDRLRTPVRRPDKLDELVHVARRDGWPRRREPTTVRRSGRTSARAVWWRRWSRVRRQVTVCTGTS